MSHREILYHLFIFPFPVSYQGECNNQKPSCKSLSVGLQILKIPHHYLTVIATVFFFRQLVSPPWLVFMSCSDSQHEKVTTWAFSAQGSLVHNVGGDGTEKQSPASMASLCEAIKTRENARLSCCVTTRLITRLFLFILFCHTVNSINYKKKRVANRPKRNYKPLF